LNNYVHIEDITVDKKFRRCGVARGLMDKAREWALECGVKGLSLEHKITMLEHVNSMRNMV